MTQSAPIPAPPRRRPAVRRILKWGVITASFLVLAVILLPTVLSMDWARTRLERGLSESLGSDVSIRAYRFGWFDGLEVEGVSIANPAGFPADVRLLQVRSLRGDFSIVSAVRGRFEVTGVVDGLELRIRQRADGTTNLQELFDASVRVDVDPDADAPQRRPAQPIDLAAYRFDLELRDAFIEVEHEVNGVLERLENVHARASKEFDTQVASIEFSSDLHRPGSDQRGRLEIEIDALADPSAPIDARLSCIGLDIARYRPILESFLSPDQLTAFGGVVSANARITGVPTEQLTVEGTIEVDAPHFAGALMQGLDLRAPRWTIRPNVVAAMSADGGPARVDVSRFEADFGFLTLRGQPPVADAPDRFALAFDLDVAGLAEAGGPIPEMLRGTGTRLHGTLRAPSRTDLAGAGPAELLAQVGLQAALAVGQLTIGGQSLDGLEADIGFDGGKLAVATTAGRFNGGALTLRLEADATDLDRPPPVRVAIGIQDAAVGSSAVSALQYAIPLFAGLAASAAEGLPVELTSRGGMELEFDGPAYPSQGQPVLEWLDGFAGRGQVGLHEGSFRPASAMAGLLQLTGEQGKLSFSDLSTAFRIKDGFVETGLMKLAAKGREYGITGRTSLAGAIDHTIDARELLRAHADGQKVLKYLGDTPVGAKLVGTLTSPSLAMPDIGALVQDALRGAIEQEGRDLIEKEAGGLLDKILGPRKGKDGAGAEPGSVEEQAKQAAGDLLRGVIGGRKTTPPPEPKKKDGS